MAQNELVGEQSPSGAEGNQPAVSQEGAKPITPNAAESQDFVSKKDFDNFVKELRGLQSRQDKSQSEQTRFMDELRQHMSKGMSLDEAEQAVNADRKAREKDDLLYQIAQKVGVSSSLSQGQPAGNSETPTVDVAKVIKDLELDGNDPEVVEKVLKQNFNSVTEAENAALKLALKRNKPSPSSPSAAPVSIGSPIGETVSTESLISKLGSLQKSPTQNRDEIKKISAELDKRGWK